MHIKTIVFAIAALVAGASAAGAADLGAGGSKDGPEYSGKEAAWTGVYLGFGLGGLMTSEAAKGDYAYTETLGSNVWTSRDNSSMDISASGIFGTIQAGADYRFRGAPLVVGAFVDYDFMNVDGNARSESWSSTGGDSGNSSTKIELNDSWTIGGRAGVLVGHGTMIYGLVGYSQLDQTVSLSGVGNTFPDGTTSKDLTHDGYTIGAGLETQLSGPLFLKGEYRYSGFNRQTVSYDAKSAACGTGCSWNYSDSQTVEPSVQSARLVLTYKFGMER